QPPYFSNLPSTITILETFAPNEHVYTVRVKDFTNDDICCTMENVRPQTLNFELLLINSTLHIYTTQNAKFVFEDFNSYQITICCEDTEGGAANGILQVDVKEVKEQEPYTPPRQYILLILKERRGSPTTPSCSTMQHQPPKTPTVKHKEDTHRKRRSGTRNVNHRKTYILNTNDYT
ncbi:hypothetical protein FSP39_024682, partial [Pinctada imbricata]